MAKTLRYSHQREKIYEYLSASKAHPSAEMIYTDLRQELPDLSLGTVYRNLRVLEELGKIRKITTQDGNDRYDALCGEHVHFVCQDCGAIIDIPDADTEALRKCAPLPDGYQLLQLNTLMIGRCPACSQQDSN